MAVEARVIVSLETRHESRVPVAVGVYQGEVIVVCPGGAKFETAGITAPEKTELTLHRVYNPTKEVRILYLLACTC